MGDELELVSDGTALAVLGQSNEVDRFLAASDFVGHSFQVLKQQRVVGTTSHAIEAVANVAANSGRWVRLTPESAQAIKSFGLMPTKTPGISHAMIGDPGSVQKWLQVDKVGSLVNPAALSSFAGFLAQQQMQQTMDEIKEYLAVIDAKVDDVLRAQKDAVLADMIGVGLMIDEAMIVRDEVGYVSEVTWSKVQASPAIIARTEAYALRQLDGLAEKLEQKTEWGVLVKATKEADVQVQEWLAVIARCFQLQDALAVLEIDRIYAVAPDDLDQHRIGLKTARDRRLHTIAKTTSALIARMEAAADHANRKVLFNPIESPAVVRASDHVADVVVGFHNRLGIESDRHTADAKRWLEAVKEVKDKVIDVGADGVRGARRAGTETASLARKASSRALDTGTNSVWRASDASSRFLTGIAERTRRHGVEPMEPTDKETHLP